MLYIHFQPCSCQDNAILADYKSIVLAHLLASSCVREYEWLNAKCSRSWVSLLCASDSYRQSYCTHVQYNYPNGDLNSSLICDLGYKRNLSWVAVTWFPFLFRVITGYPICLVQVSIRPATSAVSWEPVELSCTAWSKEK